MDNSCKVPEVKPITIKRFGTAGLVPTIPTVADCNLWEKTDLRDGEFAINTANNRLYLRSNDEIIEITNQAGSTGGSVTSVGLSMPSAFSVASSPVTSSGTLTVTGAGTTGQYIRGDGSLATFPTLTGITSLNSLTGASQTFATGTSGSDFSISSTGTTHTFNIPTASSSNRGLLSSTDWSTFNNKVSTGAITTSGLTMATARLLGRSTAGTGAVEEITVGSGLTLSGGTLTASGGISGLTANRFVYATSSTTIGTDDDAYFDGSQIAFGTTSPIANTRATILGADTTNTTFALQVHNSTGTNNTLIVRNDGRVMVNGLTSIANSPLTINLDNVTNSYLTINQPNNVVSGLQIISWGRTHLFQGGNQRFIIQGGVLSDIYIQSGTSAVGTALTVKPNTGKIGINAQVPVASARLQVDSTTEGFLPPRNTDPATNIATPAEGLIAFDTTDKKLQVFDGTNWIDLH